MHWEYRHRRFGPIVSFAEVTEVTNEDMDDETRMPLLKTIQRGNAIIVIPSPWIRLVDLDTFVANLKRDGMDPEVIPVEKLKRFLAEKGFVDPIFHFACKHVAFGGSI